MRQSIALAALHADSRLQEWRNLLPTILTEGQMMGNSYVVEAALPGREARALMGDPLTCARIQTAAATTIRQLHQRTAAVVPVSSRLVQRWIEQPLLLIQRWNATLPRTARRCGMLERLETELRSALAGRTFTLSWIHGDFWAGNLLMTPDGSTVTGIVDWDMARPNDLPLLDVLQLLLSTRMLVQRCELGDIMCSLLKKTEWQPVEYAILEDTLLALPGDTVEMRTMLLLCWLRHVAANMTKSSRYVGHWLWAAKNIEPVLQCL